MKAHVTFSVLAANLIVKIGAEIDAALDADSAHSAVGGADDPALLVAVAPAGDAAILELTDVAAGAIGVLLAHLIEESVTHATGGVGGDTATPTPIAEPFGALFADESNDGALGGVLADVVHIGIIGIGTIVRRRLTLPALTDFAGVAVAVGATRTAA